MEGALDFRVRAAPECGVRGGVAPTMIPAMIDLNDTFRIQDPDEPFDIGMIQDCLDRELAKTRISRGEKVRQAQLLFYEAIEAVTNEEEIELIGDALKLDPGNVDALLLVLNYCEVPVDEEIEILRKIVKLAERRLGPRTFEDLRGKFWGAIETRPYMRAREQLAESLNYAGRIGEAIAEWEGLLELNPHDNQGLRHPLLTSCLALNRLDCVARLFEQFREEVELSTVFAWGRVLERFLVGDSDGARKALAAARILNAHSEAYLRGRKRVPKNLPTSYDPGSREEAACFAEALIAAWKAHPSAKRWLKSQPPGPLEPRNTPI